MEARRSHRQIHEKRRNAGRRILPPLEEDGGVCNGGLELLVALRLGRHAVFVENAAQHAAELFALVPQRALNQHLHLDRPVGRPA